MIVITGRRLSGIGSSVGIMSKLEEAGLAVIQQSTSNVQIVVNWVSCEGLNWVKKGGNRLTSRFSLFFVILGYYEQSSTIWCHFVNPIYYAIVSVVSE
jgi:hypothetical protein